jgi:hypothetical protein
VFSAFESDSVVSIAIFEVVEGSALVDFIFSVFIIFSVAVMSRFKGIVISSNKSVKNL